jgi:hypothetical protein
MDILIYCPNCGTRQNMEDPSRRRCKQCEVMLDLSHDYCDGMYVLKVK